MKYAPFCIITLNRDKHFIRCIESLKRNSWAKFTHVYVGLDYPPSDKYQEGWERICQYLDYGDFSCFASFTVVRQKENVGSGKNSSIIKRLLFEKYDRLIFSEDDIEYSPNFLEYMDKCLEHYEDNPDVIAVTGYSYPIDWQVSLGATCFQQNFNHSMWGVGYWMKKYNAHAPVVTKGKMLDELPAVIREKRYKNMIDVSQKEYIMAALSPMKKMKRMLLGYSDIAMRAYLSVYGKYCITPVISKSRNHGFDGSGIYCQDIKDGDLGGHAWNYDYPNQPIDDATTFDLVEDELRNMEENRYLLNCFDYRSPSQMRRTRLYLILMEHIGVWSARLVAYMLLPYDLGIKALKRIIRKLS